jgi:hypothetical protein
LILVAAWDLALVVADGLASVCDQAAHGRLKIKAAVRSNFMKAPEEAPDIPERMDVESGQFTRMSPP